MTGDYLAEEPFCSYIPGKTLLARSASRFVATPSPVCGERMTEGEIFRRLHAGANAG
jgi:hypothetical protein